MIEGKFYILEETAEQVKLAEAEMRLAERFESLRVPCDCGWCDVDDDTHNSGCSVCDGRGWLPRVTVAGALAVVSEGDYLLDSADNLRDAAQKGRMPGGKMIGESNPASKMTEDKIRLIRHRYEQGESLRSLGRQFGLDKKTIRGIVMRETWRHVS